MLPLGDGYSGVRITDFLPNYKNLPGDHQVCWVHLLRRIRKLRHSESLEDGIKEFIANIDDQLKQIFADLKTVLATTFDLVQRQATLPDFYLRIEDVFTSIRKYSRAPKDLADIANLLEKYKQELFTCVDHPGVPPDNNKAERSLRHLVLKRKNSYGTLT